MLTNHLKTAWRNFTKHRSLSLIKITGLSIGLAVCILILFYIHDESGYDRFHAKGPQLYRIVQTLKFGSDDPRRLGVTVPQLAPAVTGQLTGIEGYVRTNVMPVIIRHNNELFEETPLCADSSFFSVFTFPLIYGDKYTALDAPHSIVLSETMAKKYFGKSDPVGKTIELKAKNEFETFKVTAVTADGPGNSTLRFDILLPFSYYAKINPADDDWIGGNVNSFLLLDHRASAQDVQRKIQSFYNAKTRDVITSLHEKRGISIKIDMALEQIADIHFGHYGQDNGLGAGSSISYSYILGAIAFFILLMACINFINLTIAQSLKRSKEVGIRKVIGSSKKELVRQFMTESFLFTAIAFLFALLIVWTLLPVFNMVTDKKLSLAYLFNYRLALVYLLLLVFTTFAAGFYPSLTLSSFQPIKTLYNRQKLGGKSYFTRSLVVLQFTLAVLLTIGTLVMYAQMNFFYKKDLGYDTENMLRVTVPSGPQGERIFDQFTHELTALPSVLAVGGRNRGVNITEVRTGEKAITIDYSKINEQYLPALKIPVRSGRNFSRSFPSDVAEAAIVNESFVREAGWPDAIGRTLTFSSGNKQYRIIGVVKDHHFRSLKVKIGPQLFTLDTSGRNGQAWIKLAGTDIPASLASIRSVFRKLAPDVPFSYQFMSDLNEKDYESEARWKRIIGIAAGLFIFISCIGLLGLIMLAIEQRKKEIGIRKVLGAAASGIVLLISKEFLWLSAIASLIAIPLGYYAMQRWLQDFAYRIDMSWWLFVLAGLLVILFVIGTISIHAFKAARAKPVQSLRTE